jgi:CTP:molybdopterin cytidylyltransferase MocA
VSHVVALLLAAGGSRRMGRPKQLLAWQGTSLVRRAAETALASRCRELVVVLGAQASLVEAELVDLPLRTCVNPDWEEGIASSLRTGVEALGDDAEAVLVLLADQPKVEASLLDRLIAAYETSRRGLAACSHGGAPGAPALFSRRYFEALGGLSGDRGARALLEAHRDDCSLVDAPLAVFDVDTPADLDRTQE